MVFTQEVEFFTEVYGSIGTPKILGSRRTGQVRFIEVIIEDADFGPCCGTAAEFTFQFTVSRLRIVQIAFFKLTVAGSSRHLGIVIRKLSAVKSITVLKARCITEFIVITTCHYIPLVTTVQSIVYIRTVNVELILIRRCCILISKIIGVIYT